MPPREKKGRAVRAPKRASPASAPGSALAGRPAFIPSGGGADAAPSGNGSGARPAGNGAIPVTGAGSAAGQSLTGTSPGTGISGSTGGGEAAADSGSRRAKSRRALRNWPVRSRLVLLIAIPTIAAVVLGGLRIASSIQAAVAYTRVERLADLSSSITSLAGALENERDETVHYIADPAGRAQYLAGHKGRAAADLTVVNQEYSYTAPWVAQVRRQVAQVGGSYPAQEQAAAHAVSGVLGLLPALRHAATGTQLPALVVNQKYSADIDALLAIDDYIALNSGDTELASTVRALNQVSQTGELASQQRALLDYALTQGKFQPGVLSALTTAEAQMNANISAFQATATPQQAALWTNTVAGSLVDNANSDELQAIAEAGNLGKSALTYQEWDGDMSGKIRAIRTVESDLVASAISRAATLRRDAITFAAITGGVVILVLALALLLTIMVGRSIVPPLRRLRSGALEIAGVRLPQAVREMGETGGVGGPTEVAPIEVDSHDEIGEVARAFDQVHREAIRLASEEAALRGNVNAMFVNLSRRSQSLVERQIGMIDRLEQGEEDPERLSSLFQMDHLATRMRRNSENLLVLAGQEMSRRWNQPVPLIDVLRAAVSEIEQYERVTLNVQPGLSVRGHAVNDIVHLLAELAENATVFSSAETAVTISGQLLTSGGVLLDITDQGVGMGAEEMAHANWRLDNPPVVDVAVSRRMGLFVVARLAARHGIRVRLRPAPSGGLTALVWLPDEVVSHEPGAVGTGSGALTPAGTAPAVGITGFTDTVAPTGTDTESAEAESLARQGEPSTPEVVAGLGPRRVPGAAGLRPGQQASATTGPQPVFYTSPRPAPSTDAEAAGVPSNAAQDNMDGFGVGRAVGDEPPSTGPLPAVSGESDGDSSFSFVEEGEVVGPREPEPEPEVTAPEPEASASWLDNGPARIVVPPLDHAEYRLPIFEAVESDWFRRGRSTVTGWRGHDESTTQQSADSWESVADAGWLAAEAAVAPTASGITSAGLPRRVPQANLVPGSVESMQPSVRPVRSATSTRDRFASFQRGLREGRAAATADEDQGAEQGDDG